jgi:uncharacterized protein (TIGR02302 family)
MSSAPDGAPHTPPGARAPAGLGRRRLLARAVLVFEQAWPAVWPAFGVLGLFAAAALFGLPPMLPPLWHAILLASVVLVSAGLLARGLLAIHPPAEADADRRLEQASGLRHRPLAALTDQAANGGDQALWRAHQARAAAMVRRLRVGLPHPGLAARDRRALRGALVVLLVAGLAVAGPDASDRLLRALSPALAAAAAPPALRAEAWATPPAWAGQAPRLLPPTAPSGAPIALDAGTRLTISVTGGAADGPAPSVTFGAVPATVHRLDAGSAQADLVLDHGGLLAVRAGGRSLAAWSLAVASVPAPIVAWASPPGPSGRGVTTRLPWQVSDAHGIKRLEVTVRLRDRPDAPPLIVPLPPPQPDPRAPNAGVDAHGAASRDLSAHPWAGLPVVASLYAENVAGRDGRSADATFTLPERVFHNPVARALIDIRRGLSAHPEDRRTALAGLDQQLVDGPRTLAGDSASVINLAALYSLLLRDHSDDAIGEAQERLWSLAIRIEEGAAARTQAELDRARAEAREALARAEAAPTAENKAALEEAMRRLEEAINRNLKALTERAQREGVRPPVGEQPGQIDGAELQRLAEEAREAAHQGKRAEAGQRLAELERQLDQLRQAARRKSAGQSERAEGRAKGRSEVSALQDMIEREGGLLDNAERRAAQSAENGGNEDQSEREADRRVQQALRRALGELMQQFGYLTGAVPPSLGDADAAMRDARGALSGEGTPEGSRSASAAEQRAIEALQKSGRDMAQSLEQKFGRGDGTDGEGEGSGDEMSGEPGDGQGQAGAQSDRNADGAGRNPSGSGFGSDSDNPGEGGRAARDPFGRPLGLGTGGGLGEDGTRVPSQMERLRTQAIEEELRRRGADMTRPAPERDYIDRLLKRF